jgi:hypothetical protein
MNSAARFKVGQQIETDSVVAELNNLRGHVSQVTKYSNVDAYLYRVELERGDASLFDEYELRAVNS